MADRLISVLVICLQLYEHVNGDYCQHGNEPSTPFCQNGTISGLIVYINGSSVKTRADLGDKRCVCYLEQSGGMQIFLDAKQSCLFCGLQVGVGTWYLTSRNGIDTYGWGSIAITDTNFTMTLGVDGTSERINTAFCITIQTNSSSNQLNLTCEELVMMKDTYSGASSTSQNVITTPPNMAPSTTQSHSPTSAITTKSLTMTDSTRSAEASKSLTKSESTITAEASIGDTNVMQDPKATDTNTAATITTAANSPREDEDTSSVQSNVIIPAAAGGGTGVLTILVIIIVACCLRKKRRNAEKPIRMKEVDQSDLIMTDNPTYAKSVDIHTNSVSHIGAQCIGDVYAVVSKEGNSRVLPSDEVPHIQVGETGDVYATVNKENAREVSNIEQLDGTNAESLVQTNQT